MSLPRFPLGLAAALLVVAPLAAQQPAAPVPATPAPAKPTSVPVEGFTVPDGFEITLWAQAPQLRNPTNMDTDAQGRIWVTEGANYRSHEGRDKQGDRIVVLEDTDGDGRADSSHVFVQEPDLVAPLGIAILDNKIIVSNAPDLIVYTDVDRNARFDPAIDKREVLLTGFNGRNHDHALHSVTFGPDGRLYFSHGNCSAHFTDREGRTFRVGSSYEPEYKNTAPAIYSWKPTELAGAKSDDGHVYVGGFTVRMKPDATGTEIIGYNYRNSYEQTVTSFGDVFQNDNDDPPACRTSFVLEYGNAGFFSRDGKRMWNADRRPGQSIPTAEWRQEDPGVMPSGDVYGAGAPTGIAFYEGDAFGKQWRGTLLSAEAARNTILGYHPMADGAGYQLERFAFATSNPSQVLAGVDSKQKGKMGEALGTFFRPSDVMVGADGAIYVADWFDPRVGGHQDFDDQTAGAIYRIAPKGFKSVVPKFDLATTAGQIAALRSPAVNVRSLGYVKLQEQGAAAVAPVGALLDDENPYIRARAIWLLADLGADGLARVVKLLDAPDADTRVTAFRALRRHNHQPLVYARKLAADASAAVRREVALSLRDVPAKDARDLLVTLALTYDGKDRAFLEAWGTGCSGKEAEVYAALERAVGGDPLKWSAAYAGLVWRLTPSAALGAFVERVHAETLSEQDRLAALTALAFLPDREAAAALLDLAQHGKGRVQQTAFWWLLNYKDTRWKDYGVDLELKARGLYDPEKVEINESVVAEPPVTKLPPAEEIAALKGDAQRGASLVAACYLCHRIGDHGVDYGPNLTEFAKMQSRDAVIAAIVNPSADISHGYDGTVLTLTDGKVIHGRLVSSGDPLVMMSMGGVTQLIPKNRVKAQTRLNRSLMLSADQLGLGAQELADIVEYLRGL